MGAVMLVVAALAVTIVGVGLAAWYGGANHASASTVTVTGGSSQPAASTATPADPAVAAGAHDFVRFACDQCHGDQGQGGVSPDVPALTTVAKSLTVAQLTTIIQHGLGESTNPDKPYMPVWHGIISPHQISDIVAYLHAGLPAVSGAQPAPVPTDQGDVVAGSILYTNLGCVNCHGPGQDPRHHHLGQRDRQAADREHAALGHHPDGRRGEPAHRLHRHALLI